MIVVDLGNGVIVWDTKDLIPTGNALRASAAHSPGRVSSKDLIPTGNALRASAAHSSGRISSKDLIPTGNALRASAAHSPERTRTIPPSSLRDSNVTTPHSNTQH